MDRHDFLEKKIFIEKIFLPGANLILISAEESPGDNSINSNGVTADHNPKALLIPLLKLLIKIILNKIT